MSAGDSSKASLPTSTLDRLSLVLDTFRSAPRLSLTEVSRGTGIPRTSTLRMLEQLVRMGWLRRRGAEYELGDTLAELGALSLYRDSVDRVVTPLLRELHLVTGHVVHLGVLDGKDVLYLEKVGGSAAPHLRTRVGTRIPARSSTIGKALLASAPRPGVSFGTCVTGFGCIGARVGSLGGAEVGLSVSGPMDRLKFDQRHAAPVRMAAAAIAHYFDLTGAGWPRA
ncbi:IclR-like helix-turn-helix domain-containing protein [Rhodococcus sp. OK611]|uniref:IclR family transcriptional regulator n=1 Tax=unclassified Rhodococcus (in: high G+C Gram-positive bacteria) TaxID=192944 RepID=UPI000BCDC15B|nr:MULTISPECIES: helix-turn-helix domain-containing protein [unclassified Rhodococcus (in: high G+C Gram-positive bacteria)]PTR45406.1 IclR-like helix-turn-helix domain-containing protein [Rhodococcus sp. OK611]SNX88956.1 IclR helix-turn-helix domain-containing protein [Rhodococcus sp. OK270]